MLVSITNASTDKISRMTLINNRRFNWFDFANSAVGKKLITGFTGLGLSLFVLFHLLGNLLILSDRQAYNQLAHWLENLHFVLYGVELLLLFLAALHIAIGIKIRLNTAQARPASYKELKSAGQPSKQSLSSRSMAITGIIIFGFLVWHLLSFKFGTYYATTVEGVKMRDLSQLVIEKFHNPIYAFGYTGAIALVCLHLRHGIWSAAQSLGMLSSSNSSLVHKVSLVVAILIGFGFSIVPLSIYFSAVL